MTRGRIGVQIQEVSKETAEAFGLPKPAGALVNSVEKGGPAEKAGVEAGDIILKVDGRDVQHVRRAAAHHHRGQAGQQGHAHRLAQGRAARHRGHRRRDEGRRAGRAAAHAAAAPKEKAKPNRMGLVLSDLTDEQKKELEVKSGVLVEDVAGGVRGNVQPGDVILAIVSRGQTTEAKSAEQVNDAAGEARQGRVGDAAAEARRAAVLLDAARQQRRVTKPAASRAGAWPALTLLARAPTATSATRCATRCGRSPRAHGATVDVIDVDADPRSRRRWGDAVPVLFARRAGAGRAAVPLPPRRGAGRRRRCATRRARRGRVRTEIR